MRRWIIAIGLFQMAALPAFGQFIQNGYPSGGQMPNIYNQQNQPLSPYLQLNRNNNNPAVNYYFGTRPGTAAGGYLGLNGNVSSGNNYLFMRQTFFPYVDTLATSDPAIPTAGIRPSGHPVAFNNALGYFNTGSFGNFQNRQGQGQNRGNQRSPGQGGSSQTGPSIPR